MSNSSRHSIPRLPTKRTKVGAQSKYSLEKENSIEVNQSQDRNQSLSRDTREVLKKDANILRESSSVNSSSTVITDSFDQSLEKLDADITPKTFNEQDLNKSHSIKQSIPLLTRKESPPSSTSRDHVLRPGETLENFFCLGNCKDEYLLKLCKHIVSNGGALVDIGKWIEIIDVATKNVSQSSKEDSASPSGADLIRLHQRIIQRLFSSRTPPADDQKKLHILLSYATAEMKYGRRDNASSIISQIKSKRLGERSSELYITMAKFECGGLNESNRVSRLEKAISIIEYGKQQNAQPPDKLDAYLRHLRSRLTNITESINVKKSRDSKRKVETNMMSEQEPTKLSKTSNTNTIRCAKSQDSKAKRITQEKQHDHAPSNSKLSKVLPKKRIGGVPLRVSADKMLIGSTSECEDETEPSNSSDENTKPSNNPRKNKPKFSRKDINYMLHWNPERPRTASDRSRLEKVEESSDTKESQTGGSGLSGSQSSHGTSSNRSTTSTKQHLETSSETLQSENSKISQKSSLLDSPTAKINMNFLHMFQEKNIVHVNKSPYAKLGVIGKGGSCKVYRALSTEQDTVAIKKVKLDGMGKKAIEGYANEIGLLKKLRKNPAIIRMYDSEVDLQRKAIYLVMEIGEVDLNYVLQNQGIQRGNESNGKGILNMNFVRLTWQQMLTAVHCIHEERIIHGDLKPANFLFVKGALKLIDFGIAKAIQSDDTTNIYRESQVGTLNYMSPESIVDSGTGEEMRMKCGKASDIWSLGCILYQMCYGKTPFADLHMIQKIQAIVNPNHKIKFPDTINSVSAIDTMKQCLKRNPEDRPPISGSNGLLKHDFLNCG